MVGWSSLWRSPLHLRLQCEEIAANLAPSGSRSGIQSNTCIPARQANADDRWHDLIDLEKRVSVGTKGSPMKSLKNGQNFHQAFSHPDMLSITCACWVVASHSTSWEWRRWLTRIVCWIKLQTEVGNHVTTTLGSIWLQANGWVMIADSAHPQSRALEPWAPFREIQPSMIQVI